jgi:hypothetical protein
MVRNGYGAKFIWHEMVSGYGTRVEVDTLTNSYPVILNSRLESTTEITQNKHVKVLHYFVDDIK